MASSIPKSGWMVPLFDSSLIQLNEDEFVFYDPVGRELSLHRDSKDRNLLKGDGWTGQIVGDSVVKLYSCDGWVANYVSGKLSQFKNGTETLVYSRSDKNDGVTVSLNGKVVASINVNKTGAVLNFQYQNYTIPFSERPFIEIINEKRVISKIGTSLGGIVKNADGSSTQMYAFEYGVSKDLQPTVSVKKAGESGQQFTWDAKTGSLISDDYWSYSIEPNPSPDSNTPIVRLRSIADPEKGEFFNENPSTGVTLTQINSGPIIRTTRHTSGLLRGKIRRVEELNSGNVKTLSERTYDEKGKLIGISMSGRTWRFSSDGNEQSVTYFEGDKKLWTKFYSADYLQRIEYPDGARTVVIYNENQPQRIRFEFKERSVEMPATVDMLDFKLDLNVFEIYE